ncbi:MAG: hypothetical protein AB1642_11835 [Pseudomonadota bacterium]
MEDEIEPPWWRTPLRVLGVIAGLLALAAASMGFIFLVARAVDWVGRPSVGAVAPLQSSPTPAEQNALTREATPYGPFTWPTSPGRPPAVKRRPGPDGRFVAGGGPAGAPAAPPVPVGVPVEDYRAAVDSGKKLYIPDPKGECDLSGASTEKSASGLEACLARRVARQ